MKNHAPKKSKTLGPQIQNLNNKLKEAEETA